MMFPFRRDIVKVLSAKCDLSEEEVPSIIVTIIVTAKITKHCLRKTLINYPHPPGDRSIQRVQWTKPWRSHHQGAVPSHHEGCDFQNFYKVAIMFIYCFIEQKIPGKIKSQSIPPTPCFFIIAKPVKGPVSSVQNFASIKELVCQRFHNPAMARKLLSWNFILLWIVFKKWKTQKVFF